MWIAGISRGHNASVCLLKDGEIVFCIEEERLSRRKYDSRPFAAMYKILDYTDKIDYLVNSHITSSDIFTKESSYDNDDTYTSLAKKLGLIKKIDNVNHPQVIDYGKWHHKMHAAVAFYRSGFSTATALVIDACGSVATINNLSKPIVASEVESIFECSYPSNIETKYKHIWSQGNIRGRSISNLNFNNSQESYEAILSDRGGIGLAYEAVTTYCGFNPLEAGKTMGLSPYGNPNDKIPMIFDDISTIPLINRNLFIPGISPAVNSHIFDELKDNDELKGKNYVPYNQQNRKDLAYAIQIGTQEQVVNLIRKAINITGNKNIVISGGYGLNCVSNYYYLDALRDEGINLYVEPVANDGGTATGAAFYLYRSLTGNMIPSKGETLYLGPEYNYTIDYIKKSVGEVGGIIEECDHKKIIDLLIDKHIVALFQGRSENGPRALGNRSILFDPRIPNGKDIVNNVKKREYFRPFAGTILEEDVHDWFDLRGMESSPFMMYAVNCKPGIEEKIPAIIHVDGTCRIQTVTEKQNKNFYDLIREFKTRTGCPILFNTSFNLAGEPLVETLEDAIRTLKNSKIEYMYLPELKLLVNIKN